MIITTDNQSELFEIVDENDKVVERATRGEVHGNKKLIHRSVGVVIFNSRGEIYLQQRSATKDTDPLKWTISCSGHVVFDSSTIGGVMASQAQPVTSEVSLSLYEKTAHRELQEELGIRNLKLEPVYKYICRAPNETEMVMLYKTVYDGLFKLKKEEIAKGKFFTRKELAELVQLDKIKLSFSGKVALEKVGWIKIWTKKY